MCIVLIVNMQLISYIRPHTFCGFFAIVDLKAWEVYLNKNRFKNVIGFCHLQPNQWLSHH